MKNVTDFSWLMFGLGLLAWHPYYG